MHVSALPDVVTEAENSCYPNAFALEVLKNSHLGKTDQEFISTAPLVYQPLALPIAISGFISK
jgi:hypothetical protein